MLTWDEASKILSDSMQLSTDDFVRDTANFIPQDVLDKLMDEMFDYFKHRTDGDEDEAGTRTAIFMMGMHMGWFLASEARK